jgi:uncharacterized protein (TIGR00106 family)
MLCAFSITPLGTGDSVSGAVADAIRIVRASGLPNETNAMFTNVEGEWDEVMALLKQCVEAVGAEAPRVSIVVKIDYRPGARDQLHEKVAAIETRLGETTAQPPEGAERGVDPESTRR